MKALIVPIEFSSNSAMLKNYFLFRIRDTESSNIINLPFNFILFVGHNIISIQSNWITRECYIFHILNCSNETLKNEAFLLWNFEINFKIKWKRVLLLFRWRHINSLRHPSIIVCRFATLTLVTFLCGMP